MTVDIAIVTGEGIVIAADSRTSYIPAEGGVARVISDFTHKVFQVGENALCTYGAAFVNNRNVAGHLAEFAAAHHGADLGPHDCARLLVEFLGPRLDADIAKLESGPPPGVEILGFLVGGYENHAAALCEAALPSGTVSSLVVPGAAWRGMTDVIGRIVKGVDLDALQPLAESNGKSEELEQLRESFGGLEYHIPWEGWNLQDAIDFAVFCVRATIDVQRLTLGTLANNRPSWPGVGGPIEIAVVTPDKGFEWVQKTRLQSDRLIERFRNSTMTDPSTR